MITSGEGFAHDVKSTDARNNLFQLRLLDSEQVYVSDTRILDAGGQIISGVEFDAGGKRVAYWVYPKRQGQLFFTAPPVRIPASEVVHLFAPLAPGQVRGISWLSTILLRLHDLDQYEDAQLVRQKIAACFTAFIKVPDDELNGGSGATDNLPPDNGMEPGAVWALRPGEDVAFSAPPGVGDAVQFIQLQLRAVAAGIGIPEHLLTGDLSQVNYSSIRAGLIEFRRRIEQLQYSIVIFQFCRPVWERFVTGSIFSGALSAPDFESNPESYFAVDWYPPAHEWVDPLKDVQADALAVQNGFKPRRQVVAGAGYDVEEIDAEFVADRAREKALGLAFSSATTATLRESDNVPPGP
jgi:lambda family phage portal protein